MDNTQIIALVAIAISVISIGLVVANIFNLQIILINLNTSLVEQSQTIKSLNQQQNVSQQIIEEQHRNITIIQNNMTNLTFEIKSLDDRIKMLEQRLNQPNPEPQPVPQSTFNKVTVVDGNGTKWTSGYIKISTIDPTVPTTCNSSISLDCYVHLINSNTPYGLGVALDTMGTTDNGYYAIGYTDEFTAPSDGIVKIAGWFQKNDLFTSGQEYSRSYMVVLLLSPDGKTIIDKQSPVTDQEDNGVWYHREIMFTTQPGTDFRIGISRINDWEFDYKIYAAWSDISINAELKK